MEQKTIDMLTIFSSLIIVICVVFYMLTISLQVIGYDSTYRYYNDHMTEWAILQFLAAFLVLQIAGYILKLREALAASSDKQ
ncbi:hypothetical protein EU527_06275 [Candidatus Thorarchaeota archaeon]|nr:MAG: hypothetical protein EU527_06275 [Candidatus Thorarchaeota archaeon]